MGSWSLVCCFPRAGAGRLLLFLLASWASLAVHGQTPGSTNLALSGFRSEHAGVERSLEAKFDSLLRPEELRDWMKRLTARPHYVGSPAGRENAEWLASLFREWGYETAIESFEVLFPTPRKRVLEMIGPEKFTARLQEPAVEGDRTSALVEQHLPTYNAYSVDGDVTGELVYVNFGIPRDYEVLAEHGVNVRGKIAIARYGGSWRGIKPKVAAEHGAIACLIYSDPHEEGYYEGDVYPQGPWQPPEGVQRGSVLDIPVYPGDPLTPGVGATPDAKRLPLAQAVTLSRIPVLPISSADALPLLRALGGPVAPEGWRGALPMTYHLGPGATTVHLQLTFDWRSVSAHNVIARLSGGERPEQWILRGNHHDAWVFGADDPVSGLTALLQEARAIGELARGGWKPKRTVVFAAWDAEEPGLLGSTEWVETHAEELTRHAVVYLNGDDNSRGFLQVGGSHVLEAFMNEVGRDVLDPVKKLPVGERLRARLLANASSEERKQIWSYPGFRIRALGSGSDYTPFLQHLGIAALDVRFGGEGEGGAYHSIYDSFDHYIRFGDPEFRYGIALAQTAGRAILRLANADVLPFEFTRLADTVGRYVNDLMKLADSMREETNEAKRLNDEHTLEIAAHPARPFFPPPPKEPVPFMNFAPLQNAVEHLRASARRYEDHLAKAMAQEQPLPLETAKALDATLRGLEQLLIRPEGLPRRPWYKHLIYAPGFYTGYGVKTVPGVREALEQRHWDELDEQISVAGKALDRFAEELEHVQRLFP